MNRWAAAAWNCAAVISGRNVRLYRNESRGSSRRRCIVRPIVLPALTTPIRPRARPPGGRKKRLPVAALSGPKASV